MKCIFLRFLFILSLFIPVGASAIPFSDLYIFGDSLSDTGNAAAALGVNLPPPYYENRISNGPVAVDVLASRLGLSADPFLLGGTNFAVAGARAGGSGIGDLAFQLGAFQTLGFDPSNALNMVFIGGNDLRDAAHEADDMLAAGYMEAALTGVDTTIRSLIGMGAEHILVPNVFDIGLIPESFLIETMYPSSQARATALTEQFNMDLASLVGAIEFDTGIDIVEFDLFAFGNEVLSDGGLFGLTNTTESCLIEGDPFFPPKPECNFDTYAFFDTIHPTARFHGLIGNALADTVMVPVPEPISLALMGIGLVGLGFVRRKLPTFGTF